MLNPVSGHQLTYISRRNAERYCKRGRARWQGDAVIFLEDTHDRRAAELSVALASATTYDRIGLMMPEQVAGLPMLGDITKLFIRT